MALAPPWIWLPLVGPVRISTIAVALAMVAILWWRRGVFTALIAVMAWLSAYEILFQATGVIIHGWSVSYFFWMSAAVGGWVVLGVVRCVRPDRLLMLATGVVWAAWILAGFNSNSPSGTGTPGFPNDFTVAGEILNEVSKTLLAAAYLIGALRTRARAPR